MHDAPSAILFITGLGRCGTTLAMRMLDMGGIPCAGPRPAYEVPEMMPGHVDAGWLASQAGKAVKWLDPTVAMIPKRAMPKTARFLLMERDPEQQAHSMCKMMGHKPSKADIRVLAASIRRDLNATRAYCSKFGPVHRASFESALVAPADFATKLHHLCAEVLHLPLNVEAAAAAVIHRRTRAAPDLSIEYALMTAEEDRTTILRKLEQGDAA
jgi:hypothetical protein